MTDEDRATLPEPVWMAYAFGCSFAVAFDRSEVYHRAQELAHGRWDDSWPFDPDEVN